jgi:hypothetical protein
MKMLERVRRRIVVMRICCLIPGLGCTLGPLEEWAFRAFRFAMAERGRPALDHQER